MKALFKNTFSDVSLLYKNFFHWNVSKLIIYIYSFILSFIFILPLILIVFIYGFISGLDFLTILSQFFTQTNDYYTYILFIVIKLVFSFVFLYGYILLIKLNFSYLNGEKLKYFKNYYFKISKILKYLGISLINFSILIIPYIIFFLINLIIVFSVYGSLNEAINATNTTTINIFSIFVFITLIITTIIFLYLLYRIYFSYFIFLEDEEKNSCLYYVKESFKKTKSLKIFFKFIPIIIIFLIIFFPTNLLLNFCEKNVYDLSYYISYNNATEEQKQSELTQNGTYIQSLELLYSKESNEELDSIIVKNNIYIILLNIFNFIFLYGVFQMVLTSFYLRKIK